MDFIITDNELTALCGLSHIQQLAYLRGIRPYMDVQTSLVGIKRGISYQSIAEQLFVEPHQGFKNESCSRMQIRRALSALERAGLITFQSTKLKLILKCELASRHFSVQNKVDLKPTHQVDLFKNSSGLENTELFNERMEKADIDGAQKADTPLKDSNYIYLLFSQFEKFWSLYPEKKSKPKAWQAFQDINPDQMLFEKMIHALNAQIKSRDAMQLSGSWVPPWKYPTNWLMQRSFEDEISMDTRQENSYANLKKRSGESSKDMFWIPDESEDEQPKNNVIQFKRY